jgi:hypothetical protein
MKKELFALAGDLDLVGSKKNLLPRGRRGMN